MDWCSCARGWPFRYRRSAHLTGGAGPARYPFINLLYDPLRSFSALAEVKRRRAFIRRIASTDIGLSVPVIRDEVSAPVRPARMDDGARNCQVGHGQTPPLQIRAEILKVAKFVIDESLPV